MRTREQNVADALRDEPDPGESYAQFVLRTTCDEPGCLHRVGHKGRHLVYSSEKP